MEDDAINAAALKQQLEIRQIEMDVEEKERKLAAEKKAKEEANIHKQLESLNDEVASLRSQNLCFLDQLDQERKLRSIPERRKTGSERGSPTGADFFDI